MTMTINYLTHEQSSPSLPYRSAKRSNEQHFEQEGCIAVNFLSAVNFLTTYEGRSGQTCATGTYSWLNAGVVTKVKRNLGSMSGRPLLRYRYEHVSSLPRILNTIRIRSNRTEQRHSPQPMKTIRSENASSCSDTTTRATSGQPCFPR
jgi:hypothetical protein